MDCLFLCYTLTSYIPYIHISSYVHNHKHNFFFQVSDHFHQVQLVQTKLEQLGLLQCNYFSVALFISFLDVAFGARTFILLLICLRSTVLCCTTVPHTPPPITTHYPCSINLSSDHVTINFETWKICGCCIFLIFLYQHWCILLFKSWEFTFLIRHKNSTWSVTQYIKL